MKIGILGVCTTTLDIGLRAASAGYDVLVNNPRGNSSCLELIKNRGSNVKMVCLQEIAQAEILILFLPWENLQATVKALPDMSGKIILHTNNFLFAETASGANPKTSAEIAVSLLPTSYIVKIYSASNFATSKQNNRTGQILELSYMSDNVEVKTRVKSFFESLQFTSIELNQIYQYNTLRDFQKV